MEGEGTAVEQPTAAGEALPADGLDEANEAAADTGGDPVVDQMDLEEVEHDGKKYAVPKALKPALMMNADYTRKTQELADQRRALEADAASTRQAIEFQRQLAQQHRELVAVDVQIEPYQRFTPEQWQQWTAQDAGAAQQAWMTYQALKDKRQGLAQQVMQAEQSRAFEAQKSASRRFEQAEADVRAEIKDWSKDRQEALWQTAVALGAKPEERGVVTSAWMVKALHRAALYDQMVQKASAPAPATPAAPTRTVGNAAKATPDPRTMSDDEWMRWREKDLRIRRQRR